MLKRRRIFFVMLAVVLVLVAQPVLGQDANVPTPESILGYKVGTDYKLTYWDKITEYFNALDKASDRVVIDPYGESTQGRGMFLAVISSEDNIKLLNKYQDINSRLANPRLLTEKEAGELAREGKAVYWVSANMHSSECASSEMVMELAYQLAVSNDPEYKQIRDNVIVLIEPSINPDGHDMYTEWYYKYINPNTAEEWVEGSTPPYYHEYISHDNNRDLIGIATVESINNVKARKKWNPTVYHDLHQSGPARQFVPPFGDTINTNVHPITMGEWVELGGHIINNMTAEGYAGVAATAYDDFYPGFNDIWTTLHNGIGILFETHKSNGANPEFDGSPKRLEREHHWYQPLPWTGGLWRISDTINYQLRGVTLAMDLVARDKKKFLYNLYRKGQDNIDQGRSSTPYAYIIPRKQSSDPAGVKDLLDNLLRHYIEIHQATVDFSIGEDEYPAGTYIVRLDQPYRSMAKTLLERQDYKEYYAEPYDITAWTFGLSQDVETIEVADREIFNVHMKQINAVDPLFSVEEFAEGEPFIIENGTNNSLPTVIINLLSENAEISQAREAVNLGDKTVPAGSIMVQGPGFVEIKTLAREQGLNVYALPDNFETSSFVKLRVPKIGLYHDWIRSDTEREGWVRLLFDKKGIPYERLTNEDIIAAVDLEKFDVIVMPDVRRSSNIFEGDEDMPEAYRGGLGDQGVSRLVDYIKGGGRLVTIRGACEFALDHLGLTGVELVDTDDINCPGSILEARLDDLSNPIAFGYGLTIPVFSRQSPVFEVISAEARAIASYTDNPLLAGYLKDEEKTISGKQAIVQADLGEGDVILFGPAIVNRLQAKGTFSFLFNALFDAEIQ